MISVLTRYIHFFIAIYAAYSIYEQYQTMEKNLQNEENRKPEVEKKILQQEEKLKRIEAFFADIDTVRENILKVEQDLVKLQQQLPSKKDDIENLTMIRNLAKKVNLLNKTIVPSEEVAITFYYSSKYSLEAQGTFLQWLIFLEQIANGERLLNIPNISIKLANKDQLDGRFILLNARLEIESYRYNENFSSKDTGLDEIETKYKDILQNRKDGKKIKGSSP